MASVIAASNDVWIAESGEGYESFRATIIDNYWKLNYHTLACTLLDPRRTGKELSEIFVRVMRKFKIDLKIGFITTDGAINAKRQVKFNGRKHHG